MAADSSIKYVLKSYAKSLKKNLQQILFQPSCRLEARSLSRTEVLQGYFSMIFPKFMKVTCTSFQF